ncbi:MAG: UDP-glucose/GDP-mannose dehydrogenase family protein [Deltaproteobacteria bacterium]|nr:UDP-glucose/GDP-mannose dehydrogenase family protein [Deltaproteobacteria bacterium]
MRISIFGAGYVGVVTACCLAARGHYVILVDINENKIDMLNRGMPPIIEKEIPELLRDAQAKNLIFATIDHEYAIVQSEISIICVGTPSRENGSLETRYMKNVCAQIGKCLDRKDSSHILVFRSTMIPGTCREIIIPILEFESHKKEGEDFFVVYNPEFLREATAVFDFNHPPKTVVGAHSSSAVEKTLELYRGLPGPLIKTTRETAEIVKYVDNAFHALKITFANEIGRLCKKLKIDSHEVMNIFSQDTKLNISSLYLKPGFAFGGSCLPKDLRAINYLSKMLDLELPVCSAILPSNSVQILAIIKKIISFGKRKIGFAGLSFKAETDDLRESPLVELIETLLGKGFDIKVYDSSVMLARLFGANKEYINSRIPHISSLMVDSLEQLVEDREVLVIGNASEEFKQLPHLVKTGQKVFDLVRINDLQSEIQDYEGICW